MKLLPILFFVPSLLLAQECRLIDKTTSKNVATIERRTEVMRFILTHPTDGTKLCQVRFDLKINGEWHRARHETDWENHKTIEQACGRAVQQAERNVLDSVAKREVYTETLLVCNDDLDHIRRQVPLGTVAQLSSFKSHPDYPNDFVHNGATCRWFIETEYKRNQIYNAQGVICNLKNNHWVVVDRF